MEKPLKPELRRLCSIALASIILLSAVFGASLITAASQESSDEQLQQQALDMYDEYKKDFLQVRDINAESAIGLLSDPDVVFVDVRRRKEQTISMIPGAITVDEFKDHLEQYRDKRIITYCTISYRSGKLASSLMNQGLSVTNLRAGLLGWVHAGGPLIDDSGATNRLHVYGRKWDMAPENIATQY